MKFLFGTGLLWLLAVPAALAGDEPASRIFSDLAGNWQGTGTVNAMAADMRMSWQPVLDGRFQHLALDNRMTGADGKEWHFEAQAFYRIEDDGSITGNWFDNRGMSLPIQGSIDGDGVLTIDWGSESTERGRSSYRLAAEGLEVIDQVMQPDGKLRSFGRSMLKRAP